MKDDKFEFFNITPDDDLHLVLRKAMEANYEQRVSIFGRKKKRERFERALFAARYEIGRRYPNANAWNAVVSPFDKADLMLRLEYAG